jgi:hypothetical protein
VRAQLVSGHYGAPQTVDGMIFPAGPSVAALSVRSQADIGPLEPALLLREGLFGTVPAVTGPQPLQVFLRRRAGRAGAAARADVAGNTLQGREMSCSSMRCRPLAASSGAMRRRPA